MKLFKKVTAILLAFVLLIPYAVYAGENVGAASGGGKLDLALFCAGEMVESVHFDPDFEINMTDGERIVYDSVREATERHTKTVDISAAGFTDAEALAVFLSTVFNYKLYDRVIDDKVNYTAEDGVISSLTFSYPKTNLLDKAEIDSVNKGIAHALLEVEDGMSDLEKALVLHDYLVREVDYDYENFLLENIPASSFLLDGVFVQRVAVCAGYADAYSLLLSLCGIDSYYISSETMNHAWNIVKIDGEWYHVDTTWDDPIIHDSIAGDITSEYVTHRYFLRSNSEFQLKLDHKGWTYPAGLDKFAEDSTKYVGYSFRPNDMYESLPGLMNKIGDKYYSLSNSGGSDTMNISSFDGKDFKTVTLNKYYEYLCELDGKLYVNDEHNIYELGTDGKIKSSVYHLDEEIHSIITKLDSLLVYYYDGNTIKIKTVLDGTTEENYIVEGDYTFILKKDGEAILVSYVGDEPHIVIPGTVRGHKVTQIGSEAFIESDIHSVVIPDTVRLIGKSAFYQLQDLEKVTLPASLEVIDQFAFYNDNNLKTVVVPKNVKKIDQYAFEYCRRLSTLVFEGDAPEIIGQKALTRYDGQSPLMIAYKNGKKGWTSDTWTDNYSQTYPTVQYKSYGEENDFAFIVTPDGKAIVTAYLGHSETVSVPPTLGGCPVTEIGSCAFFYNEEMVDLTLPDSVEKIGDQAFYTCWNILNIDFPSSLKEIGFMSFYQLVNIKQYVFPKSLRKIGDRAFEKATMLKNVYFEGDVPTEWGDDVITGESNAVTVHYTSGANGFTSPKWTDPKGKQYNSAVYDANGGLTYTKSKGEITITGYDGVKSKLVIPSEIEGCPVTAIADNAFKENGVITIVSLPDSIKSVGDSAFMKCSALFSVNIPKSVETIGNYAFFNLNFVTEYHFPSTLKSIGAQAFAYNQRLTDVYFEGDVPEKWGANVFYTWEDSEQTTVHYNEGANGFTSPTWTDPNGFVHPSEMLGNPTEPEKFSVKGKVKSYNPSNPITVSLVSDGEVKYTATIPAQNGEEKYVAEFEIPDVAVGKYDLVIEKVCHIKYTVRNVTVSDSNIDLTKSSKNYNIIDLIAGDADGNGSVNPGDVMNIRFASNINHDADKAENPDADVNGDGVVNPSDVLIVRLSTNINKSASDCTYDY